MKRFLIKVLLAISLISFSQTKEYVCTPCGSSCDSKVYDKPGMCSQCNMALVEKSSVKVINLSLDEMCERLSANPEVVLLDVRSPSEFKGTGFQTFGHFKKAININITELENRLTELEKYKNSEIIVYCSHSMRSPRATHLLGTRGFKNVKNMTGGVSTIPKRDDSDCLKRFYQPH